MARLLLLVPTSTYRVADFLEAARVLGVDVVVGTEQSHVMADGTGAFEVPLGDPERAAAAIVAHDSTSPIDAVVAVDDQGTVAAAVAATRLGLRHNPPEAARATRDKLLMRRLLDESEVPQPAFAVSPASDGPDDLVQRARALGFPCVVKPATLSGSQGVLRADDEAGVVAAATRVRRIATAVGVDPDAPLLLERFVPGPEVAVEGLLRAGELEVLAVFDKPDPLDGPAFEETIYVTPSRLPAEDHAAATAAVSAAARAMGLVEGPVHAEVRVEGGRAAVIEVAARTIGGLCARTLSFGTGHTLEELVIAHAVGLPLEPMARRREAAGVLMIPVPRAGTLRAVSGRDDVLALPGVTGLEITTAVGKVVAPPPEGNRYLGFVFARGLRPADVESALRAARARLVVDVEPMDDPVDAAACS
ncbi:MAG TPA: ATP-grasp domain-containing protein [Acidimicrobiales bacterium]|nr:ATP-grasp domain-containing protein [Acidimicrobiales bacterium]